MPNEEKSAEELAEEAGAQVAEEEKKEGAEEEVVEGEEKKEEVKAPSQEDRFEAAIGRLTEVLKPGMSKEQQETEIKRVEEESGLSRKQLGFIVKNMQTTAITANLGVHQELGKLRAEKALGSYAPKLKDKVLEEMKKLPAETQANPEAWEQMAYMLKGKHMENLTAEPAGNGSGRRVAGGTDMKGLSESKGGGSSRKQVKEYNDDEKTVIRQYFGGKPEDYEKAKASKTLSERRADLPSGGNAADKELQRLTGGVLS